MRTIGVVTVARSDYGYYLPLLRQIEADPDLRLSLIVGGMHLSPEFGLSVRNIEKDGFEIAERVELLLSTDTPAGIAKSIGLGVIGFSQAYARLRPDLLVLLGDRFEMLAAAIGMLPFAVPLAHIAGGETTEGATDEAVRHSITKMSHLHFVSTEDYRRRVIQMGEEPWRVTVSGAPSLDNLERMEILSPAELESRIGLPLQPAPLLVTFHPVTLEHDDTDEHLSELFAALEACGGLPIIFTFPNADTHNSSIIAAINEYVSTHENSRVVINLGTQGYFSLMKHALAMVGNSSSGIIEAASFKLPVVNIGNRQRGRLHDRNVLDVPCQRAAILTAIHQAISPEFRRSLEGLANPYGDGKASDRIMQVLRETRLDRKLLVKHFYDLPAAR